MASGKRAAGSGQGAVRGRLPSKRVINLIAAGEKHGNPLTVLLILLLVAAGAAAFAKFGVVDRLDAIQEVRHEAAQLQLQLNEGEERVAAFEGLNDVYAHYTWSGMTEEELRRPDTAAVLDLLERVVLSRVELDAWTLAGNELTVTINGGTLQTVNEIAGALDEEPVVDSWNVNTAAMNSYTTSSENVRAEEIVRASIVIYLRAADREVSE